MVIHYLDNRDLTPFKDVLPGQVFRSSDTLNDTIYLKISGNDSFDLRENIVCAPFSEDDSVYIMNAILNVERS